MKVKRSTCANIGNLNYTRTFVSSLVAKLSLFAEILAGPELKPLVVTKTIRDLSVNHDASTTMVEQTEERKLNILGQHNSISDEVGAIKES
ncbi:hypothetical protein E4T56_gene16809 [Termitomyces sp. T112]|nr:hypothetical protein E4T56_gene16809 [Termitomyces sp. T112]